MTLAENFERVLTKFGMCFDCAQKCVCVFLSKEIGNVFDFRGHASVSGSGKNDETRSKGERSATEKENREKLNS